MSLPINIFSVHYFLWFAGLTPIYGYILNYAQHYANATPSQYGLLNMVLPFAGILAKIFFCSLVDRLRAYRSFFILFLVTALIGFGSFAVLPFFIKPQTKDLGLNVTAWYLICIMTSISVISMSVVSCLSDAFAMNSSKKTNTSYGIIRLWGTIGWGVSSLLLSSVNQITSLPYLVPGLLMLIFLISSDIIAQTFWPNSDDYILDKSSSGVDLDDVVSGSDENRRPNNTYGTTSFDSNGINSDSSLQLQGRKYLKISSVKIQWLLFKEVAKRRLSLFRYMTLFTISGALISIQWSYFFKYLEGIYSEDFTYISAVSMVGQSFLGELPFFIISKYIIRFLGRSHTLSISIASLGFRYLMYEYLLPNSNMYFILLTESFQGPSFGLFYVVMTEVGLDYSECEGAIIHIVNQELVENAPDQIEKLRQALRATMQSVMSACYEGLGLGIGSIVGGLVIDYYGYAALWFWFSITAFILGIANVMIELFNLSIFVDENVIASK